ncbi:MAG: thiamine pyrophosphate-dependent enzyme, partial [Alphaproteobacteria bacterium]|nr:thiamine pyrophosphate-dependent enzyme [Alphaproteobacteria bacterium]
NNELGKISKEQKAGGWETWATDLINPDFAQFATSCGGLGIKIYQKKDLHDALVKLMSFNGPALIEITTDSTLI